MRYGGAPVGRHGKDGPLVDFLCYVDVFLTGDGDVLGFILKVLDVVVDVEHIFIQFGKVMQLGKGNYLK